MLFLMQMATLWENDLSESLLAFLEAEGIITVKKLASINVSHFLFPAMKALFAIIKGCVISISV